MFVWNPSIGFGWGQGYRFGVLKQSPIYGGGVYHMVRFYFEVLPLSAEISLLIP